MRIGYGRWKYGRLCELYEWNATVCTNFDGKSPFFRRTLDSIVEERYALLRSLGASQQKIMRNRSIISLILVVLVLVGLISGGA